MVNQHQRKKRRGGISELAGQCHRVEPTEVVKLGKKSNNQSHLAKVVKFGTTRFQELEEPNIQARNQK